MPYITCSDGKTYSTHDRSEFVNQCKSEKIHSNSSPEEKQNSSDNPDIVLVFLLSVVIGFLLPFIANRR